MKNKIIVEILKNFNKIVMKCVFTGINRNDMLLVMAVRAGLVDNMYYNIIRYGFDLRKK